MNQFIWIFFTNAFQDIIFFNQRYLKKINKIKIIIIEIANRNCYPGCCLKKQQFHTVMKKRCHK